ncbi:MAG: 30S ribosomal protein S12 methylthiotransferase RimO, partial [Spirochaetota bacterium]|nr:30S ribosomal protein S12 methylthiotransferase RimO [Spirochaetota bacterium]
ERQMDRFVGLDMDILIEEKVESESMALGRGYIHAPEVDGSVVVLTDKAVPGTFIKCRITGRNGIDLEAVPLNEL